MKNRLPSKFNGLLTQIELAKIIGSLKILSDFQGDTSER